MIIRKHLKYFWNRKPIYENTTLEYQNQKPREEKNKEIGLGAMCLEDLKRLGLEVKI